MKKSNALVTIKKNKDIIIYFVGKVLIGIIGIFLVSLYTYNLAPEDYGNYSLIVGIISVLISIFIGWIASAAARYYDEYKEERAMFLSNILILWFVMTVIMIGIMLFLSGMFNIVDITGLNIYVIITITFFGFVMIFESVMRSAHLSTLFVGATALQSLINIGIFYVGSVYFHMGIKSVFIAGIVSNGVFILITAFKFKLFSSHMRFKLFSKKLQTRFFYYGWPMLGMWGLGWILNLSDRYIIKIYQSNAEVGIYDIAYKIAGNMMNLIVLPFTMAVFPIVVTAWNSKIEGAVESILSKSIEYYLMIGIPAAIGLIGVRKVLFSAIISPEYVAGSDVVIYVSLGLLFNGLNQLLYKPWELKEKTKVTLLMTLISATVNIILNFMLIPKFGYISAALSTLIAFLVTTLIIIKAVQKEITIKIHKVKIVKMIFSSLVMLGVLTWVTGFFTSSSFFELLLLILIGILVYFALIYALGVLKEQKSK